MDRSVNVPLESVLARTAIKKYIPTRNTPRKEQDMLMPTQPKHNIFTSLLFLNLVVMLGWATWAQALTIKGVGKLEFGMKPSEVEVLEGCSSQTECLYDLLGKNRYFTLVYDAKNSMESTPPPTAHLTHIDIDMGNHTKEWFGELYEVLLAQYPLSHIPTEQEELKFQKGIHNELTFGFAEGSVLLKIIRRKFGNMILHVVYQDEAAAEAQRQYWIQVRTQAAAQ